jgi:ATP-binding cassette subfamily B (MDR/TAP) protein 6
MGLLSVVHYRKDSKVDGADALRALDPGATEATTDASSLFHPSTKPGLYGTFTKAFISPEKNGKSLNTDYPTTGSSSGAEIKKDLEKEQEEQVYSFKDIWTKMKRLVPFMYPKGNTWLQFLIILTGFFLLLGRVVNLLVPIQTKRVVSRLYTDDRKCSNGSILRRTGLFCSR